MASEISEGLSCPICFEIPEAEVYQCDNEHWLCSKCYFKINPPLCPECRSRLDRDRPRRCRAVERILEGIKSDCAFKSNGCDKKLSRGSAKGHQAECIFNFDKFGQFVNLCKSIGYPNCGFKFNSGNSKEAVEHFVPKHGCILTTSKKFQMELTFFKESAKAGGSGLHFWTPIITDLKERKCFFLTLVVLNKVDNCFTWLSLYLPYPNNEHRESSPVEIEYTMEIGDTFPVSIWIVRPVSLKHANNIFTNQIDFVNNSLPFIKGCSKEGSLLIDCNIRGYGVAVPDVREQMESFVCTRNTNSFSFVDNIQLQKPKVPIRFDRYGGGSAAKSFRDKLGNDCKRNRNNFLPSMRNLFEGKKPAGLTSEDVEWLKTDLIFITTEYGNVEALKYLIGKGVNFNIVGIAGKAPLHYTMWDNDQKIGLEKAKLLVDSGNADVHVLDDGKWSVLHHVARVGSCEALEYFLQKGCDVNAKSDNGWTPLHRAVFYNREEKGLKIAKSLVANGADPTLKENSDHTALEVATMNGRTKIAQLLCSHQSSR